MCTDFCFFLPSKRVFNNDSGEPILHALARGKVDGHRTANGAAKDNDLYEKLKNNNNEKKTKQNKNKPISE